MNSAEQQVLDMVAAGKITAAEGDELLRAVRKRPSKWQLLFNPFERIGTTSGVAVTGLLAVAGIAVSLLGVRFDGALDLHRVGHRPSLLIAVFDSLNATLVTAMVFWLTSRVVARQGRFLDFLVTVGIARAPYLATAVVLALISPDPETMLSRARTNPLDPVLLLTALISLTGLAWFVTLLFTGFRTASGLRGARLAGGFAAALLVSEVATKVLLAVVPLT
jgi:hypothetical protein